MLIARHLVVKGQVQGVGFRMFAEAAARHEGLSGWVANRADGSVEIHAEGDREAVERFERRVRRGPPSARVESVDADEQAPSARWTGFSVRS
jgi:acylphosphatase